MTSTGNGWQQSLQGFFDQRGSAIAGVPTLEDLCYIAGRDPRVWFDAERRTELADSILGLTQCGPGSSVLEVGSAAGFIAQLVAPRVARFVGVDLAEAPLEVARRLALGNAEFVRADGSSLPYSKGSFHGVFCYDVFTNFPSIDVGLPLVREMLRVVAPGGKVLVGNIPDAAERAAIPVRVAEVSRELDERFGPLPTRPERSEPAPKRGLVSRLFGSKKQSVIPGIVTYDFRREDFLTMGRGLGVAVSIHEVHRSNPYFGLRFNAVFEQAK
ncbi:MAG: class I SAM-dependent methyltransferase [Rhizobiaceae bacterium]